MTEHHNPHSTEEFELAEERVEARSAVFKKELGLTDLALTQVLFIVGLPWIGVAAKQGPSHIVLWLLAMLLIRIAQSSVMFAGNTRLPMVAGWDRLLPNWFTKLHARYKTPVNSIIFVGAATLALGIAGLIGVGKQEAFQLLWNASGLFYALTYVAMFAIPLIGLRELNPRPPIWLKGVALSGLLMTLIYVGVSIVPIIQVESRLVFALKISGLIVVTNIIGLGIFLVVEKRRRNTL